MTLGRRRKLAICGLGAVLALTATACLQDPNPRGGAGAGGLDGFVDGGSADGDGVVTILGAFGGQEEAAFVESLAAFEEESGIDVQYTADTDFTTTILARVSSGDSPDIGLFPQPGGLLDLADRGNVQPIDTFLDYDSLDKTLIPGFLDSARLSGRVYGAPMRMAVKSVVWYPKEAYEAGGWNTEPATIQELADVAEEIKDSGAAPWCMGWESDQATGWVGTDWIEEYVLRLHGPEVYDEWVNHEIPFDDERIVEAFEEFGKLAKGDGNVLGGERGILNTGFADAMTPAFREEPRCYLHRQGNFATGFYPDEVQADLDNQVGIFVFPPFDGGYQGQPILGGGDLAALFNGNDEEAMEVMRFLASDEFGAEWAATGGWLSPHRTFDADNYPDETTRQIAEIASEADVFRYDASDLMPKEVGSGTFWTSMVQWMDGSKTSQEAAADIENSWPSEDE
ncbi:ABC transporter substrate-binding protein [Nocardioides sp.]|uniref:ABC transporter substrate-binding protein n=1 Tax=Nocardioides sp. TaxID=35761 RepID=UPI0027335867|nr:extracellular solute-binding protein [Nocardioides sp.]MDP3890506.1 extracellular solute-binding protein [Nocardioides sp.]